MQLKVLAKKCLLADSDSAAVACAVFEAAEKGGKTELPAAAVKRIDARTGGVISASVSAGEFTGKAGTVSVYRVAGIPARLVILVGLGKKADFDAEAVRCAAGKAACAARNLKAKSLAFCADSVVAGTVKARDAGKLLAEGAVLGLYAFDAFKTQDEADPKPALGRPRNGSPGWPLRVSAAPSWRARCGC